MTDMRFKSATIKIFRRFTDLTVQDVPETARLIILVGPNGCGKSSFFDALSLWSLKYTGLIYDKNKDYYHKAAPGATQPSISEIVERVEVAFYGTYNKQEQKKAFYVRSSYRNDPDFEIRELTRVKNQLEEQRISRMIENDAAVSRNYKRVVSEAFENAFEQEDGSMTLNKFREQTIGEIKEATKRLFSDLEFNSLANPLKDGTFRFTKGTSRRFSFKNLSGGEKAAFDLILDLVVARRSYDNTVFCIDEPESHMHARLQAEFLSVLYDLVPENCQLMLATHSIGMMRRARDIERDEPGSVVFLDFGNRDFDEPHVIKPTKPDRMFWNRAYNVALDDLAALVSPSRVVICEGYPKTENPVNNHSNDARCYECIFESEFPETRFVSMGNDREIVGDKRGLAEALRLLIGGLEIVRLIDRDDLSDNQVDEHDKRGVVVLSRRNLESYLFDDEVLRALAAKVVREDKIDELLAKKQCILAGRTSDPKDDLKPASGQIYVACKNILGLTQCGNDAKAFMRDTLAPLITPEMTIYHELKGDIFGVAAGSV